MSTRNIVPRIDGEGNIGTSSKRWIGIYSQLGSFSSPVSGATPTLTNHLATKQYVDNQISVTDKLEVGDSKIEVFDTGTGYIGIEVDGGEVGRWVAGGLTLKSDILPDMAGGSGNVSVHNIGSASQKLANIHTEHLYMGSGSLYIDGIQFISTSGNDIVISADPGQNIILAPGDGGTLSLGTSADTVDIPGQITVQGEASDIVNEDTDITAHTEWQDSKEVRFGNDNDMQIYHDGSNGYFSCDTGMIHVDTDVLPDMVGGTGNVSLHSIGTSGQRFLNLWVDDLHLGPNSLYVNEKLIVEDDADTINFRTDADQALVVRTYGSGTLTLKAENAILNIVSDDEVNANAKGGMQWDVPADNASKHINFGNLSSGGNVTFSALGTNGQVQFSADDEIDLTATVVDVNGNMEFGDNNELRLGDSNDLSIYHDGSHSYIDNDTGNLYLRVNSTEDGVTCLANGSVNLYYDANAKLSTSDTGVTVTGTVVADGLDMGDNEKILIGTGDDFEMYHDASNNYISSVVTGLPIKIYNGLNTEDMAVFTPNGSVALHHDGDKVFETSSSGIEITGDAIISGNFSVLGTEFITHTEHVSAADNMIVINAGEEGAGVTAGIAGIEIDRGSATAYRFFFDETDDNFQVGEVGSLQAVATREDTPTVAGISFWNNGTSSFDTAAGLTYPSNKLTLSYGTGINEFSTDGALTGDSDDAVPTEKATKTYVDTKYQSYNNTYSSATSWVIAHSLDSYEIIVQCWEGTGAAATVVIPDSITADSVNQVTISFGSDTVAGRCCVVKI